MKTTDINCKPSEDWLIDDRYDSEVETSVYEVDFAGIGAELTIEHDDLRNVVVKVKYYIPDDMAKHLHAITDITDELVKACSGSDQVDGLELVIGDVWVCGEKE